MKKLFFTAIAAVVMVSVSNVFATSKMESERMVTPIDTATADTMTSSTQSVAVPAGQSVQPSAEAPALQPADTTESNSVSSGETAMIMYSDSTVVDSTKTEKTAGKTPDVA